MQEHPIQRMTVRNGIGFPGTWRRVTAAVISLTKQYLSEGKTSAWYHYMSRPEFVEGEANMRAIQWAAVRRGDIDTVATDHCPFRFCKPLMKGNNKRGIFFL